MKWGVRYCPACGRYVKPVKRPFNSALAWITLSVYFWCRLLFCRRRFCPICGCRTKRSIPKNNKLRQNIEAK